MYAPMDDDEKKSEQEKSANIHELQAQLDILQESNSGLQDHQERLEVDIKRLRKLLADEAKELTAVKTLMAKQLEEVEKKEQDLEETEKKLLNNQGEKKRIDNKMRELRHR